MFRRASGFLAIMAFGAGLTGAAGETDAPWIRGIFTGRSPRAVALTETEAWRRASTAAEPGSCN
jgi:hypothetical protein